jgi:hypothetical protein
LFRRQIAPKAKQLIQWPLVVYSVEKLVAEAAIVVAFFSMRDF